MAAWPAVRVSAVTGAGLPELIQTLLDRLGGRPGKGTPILSHLRQVEAAREARQALLAFAEGVECGTPWDFLAEDLRAGLGAIGRLTGRSVGPEVLREIFSRFCVGK